MTVKTWKIIDIGGVDLAKSNTIEFACPCGTEAELPVNGRALAQTETALVFDIGHHAMPAKIQCRKCRRILEREAA